MPGPTTHRAALVTAIAMGSGCSDPQTDAGNSVAGPELSACASLTTTELALTDLGPDGSSVASHLDALRGTYTVPLDWTQSATPPLPPAQSGSTVVDVTVEPRAMVVTECESWLTQTTVRTWSVQASVSLSAQDGLWTATLEPAPPSEDWYEYRYPPSEEASGRGYFLLRVGQEGNQVRAVPGGMVQGLYGEIAVVNGVLKGTLQGAFSSPWSARLNDDGCPLGTLGLDASEPLPMLGGRTAAEFAAQAQEQIASLAPVVGQWILPRFENGMAFEDVDGEPVEMEIRSANPDWLLCNGFDYLYAAEADFVLDATDDSFSILLDGRGYLRVEEDGVFRELRQYQWYEEPVQIGGLAYRLDKFWLSVAATDTGTDASGRIELSSDPALRSSPTPPPEYRILTW